MHLDRTRVFVASLVLTAAGNAQHVTSPKGHLSVEGASWSTHFGAYPDSRHMLFDGELRGKAGAIKEVAVRGNYAPYDSSNGTGRKWTSVSLTVAEADMSALSSIFLTNFRTTPTRVFNGSVTWPTRTGLPSTLPSKFDTVFPFTSSWNYGGSRDIALDFNFNGGALANKATWGSADARPYHLDAYPGVNKVSNTSYYFGNSGPGRGCIDGGTAPQGGINFLHINAYNSSYPDPKFRNKYQLYTFSYFTAPGQAVAQIVNFVGVPAGIDFPGVTCNKLYINPAKFRMVNVTKAANTTGAWSGFVYPTGTPDGLLAYNAAYAGLPMWAQTFWNDSKNGAVRLSRAISTTIPWLPDATQRSSLYQYRKVIKDSAGFGPVTAAAFNPILRYAR